MIKKVKHEGTMSEKRFKIIPESKTIIGEMNISTNIVDDISKHVSPKEIIKYMINWAVVMGSDTYGPLEYEVIKSKATCDDRDEYDENRGIGVASAKLELKKHRRLSNMYKKAVGVMVDALIVTHEMINFHEKKIEAIENDLVNYYGWENK